MGFSGFRLWELPLTLGGRVLVPDTMAPYLTSPAMITMCDFGKTKPEVTHGSTETLMGLRKIEGSLGTGNSLIIVKTYTYP
jgi:hypothetical protein